MDEQTLTPTALPPVPPVSEDGRFWFDGQAWVPFPQVIERDSRLRSRDIAFGIVEAIGLLVLVALMLPSAVASFGYGVFVLVMDGPGLPALLSIGFGTFLGFLVHNGLKAPRSRPRPRAR